MKKHIIVFIMLLISTSGLMAQQTIFGTKHNEINLNYPQNTLAGCDTIFSFETLDDWPTGLVSDGSYLYSIGYINQEINKYTLAGQLAGTIYLPDTIEGGGDLDFDGTYLWMVSEMDEKIYKIDPEDGTILAAFPLPTPYGNNYGCACDNGFIWITEYVAETLIRINAATGALVESFSINRWVLPLKIINGSLYGIEFIEKTSYGPMQLIEFDKMTGAAIDSAPWCLPYSLGLCWDGNHLWGLSSGAGIGTRRIYEFESMPTAIDHRFALDNRISVYPNPSTDHITINAPQKSEIEILNTEGQTIKLIKAAGNYTTMDISGLPAGMYLIKVKTETEIAVKKLLKE